MSEQEIENHRKSKLPPSALKLPGMEILLKPKPKQRFSLQPIKSIDNEAKLLLPSQIVNNQLQQQQPQEQPKIEKLNLTNNEAQQQVSNENFE
jgi:hypothetical protein